MTTPRWLVPLYLAICATAQTTQPNIKITRVMAGSAAALAGLKSNDSLAGWSQGAAAGLFHDPFDLTLAEREQGEKGPVTIRGRRGDVETTWTLPGEPWGIVAMSRGAASEPNCRQGEESFAASRFREAGTLWEQCGTSAASDERAWLLYRAAGAFALAQLWGDADRNFAAARQTPQSPNAVVEIEYAWAGTLFQRNDWNAAKTHFESSMAAATELHAPLSVAYCLFGLGRIGIERRQPKEVIPFLREALKIRNQLAPDKPQTGDVLNGLGRALYYMTQLDEAESCFAAALKLSRGFGPGSMSESVTLHNLGLIALGRDNLDQAREYFLRSMEISQKLDPEGIQWANSADSLGNTDRRRGDLKEAESYQLRALAVRRKLQPSSLALASSLNNLGNLHRVRGDLTQAEADFREAMALNEKRAPKSREIAGLLENLGTVAQARGDVELASGYYRKALAMWAEFAPGSVYWAGTLINLGLVAQDQGKLDDAEKYYHEALNDPRWQKTSALAVVEASQSLAQLYVRRKQLGRAVEVYAKTLASLEKDLPGSPALADVQSELAAVAIEQNQWARAAELYERSLRIRERLLPGTAALAESLHGLGLVARHAGDISSAERFLSKSIDALDVQNTRLGGTEIANANFRGTYYPYYRDYVDLLVATNRPADAFFVLERSRGRALLDLLAQRDIAFKDVPPMLIAELRRTDLQYDGLQAQLGQKPSAQDEMLESKLRELGAARAQLIQQIRDASPRFATLKFPLAVDVKTARSTLDPGTTLVSYMAGPERTLVFVVQPAGNKRDITVTTIPVTEAVLREKIRRFRAEVQSHSVAEQDHLKADAKGLYDLLLRPVETSMKESDRLLIVPDGPLHTLPFGALMRPDGRFLVAWKPIHSALSATLYGELKKTRRAPESYKIAVAAFGDPEYPPVAGPESAPNHEAAASARSLDLRPLPFSRLEVQQAAEIFHGSSRLYLGPDATEERARSAGTDTRILHFAVHGRLDERLPLNSALAFSIPAPATTTRQNGFLQAWELYEDVHWDADLVVLSACESGLGQEVEGEGLIGLTRAIQYAGARSVISSLWSIDDRRTADLMSAFYRSLKSGKSKDQALREAQLQLLQSRASANPFYWAAFSLQGDWQ